VAVVLVAAATNTTAYIAADAAKGSGKTRKKTPKGIAQKSPPEELIHHSVNTDVAKGSKKHARKNPPKGIARKSPPKGLLVSDSNIAMAVASLAAATNTTAYIAQYGGGHYRLGNDDDSSTGHDIGGGISRTDNFDETKYDDDDEGGMSRTDDFDESKYDDDDEGGISSTNDFDETKYDDDNEGGGIRLEDHDVSLSSHSGVDDNDYVDIDIDSQSKDKMRSLFPKNRNQLRKLLIGGPQARDTTGMTECKKAFVEMEDKVLRKKWTDAQHWQRLKTNKVGSPPCNKMGHVSDTLRPLVEVEKYCLCVGQMFPNKDIFWMRIAEEALLQNINVRVVCSEYMVLTVCGPSFHCKGTFREGLGWKCKVAICREGNDTSNIPDRTTYNNMNKPLHTPLYYK
jgi:hypothetical protein